VLSACLPAPADPRALEEIRAVGELRVLVRPGFLKSPPPGDGLVDQVFLLRQLSGRLGVGLRWIECRRNDLLLSWLAEGRADLAVSRFSPASLLDSGDRPSATVDWVEDLLVAGLGTGITSFGGLQGREVHVLRSNCPQPLLTALEEERVEIRFVPEETTIEEVVDRVRSGRYDMTVVDSGLLDVGLGRKGLRVIGPLVERRPLVWAVPERAPRLGRAVSDFLFAEKVLSRGHRTTACRDLGLIKQARVLRLITRNSPTTCTVNRGGLEGFEYDLALAFTRKIGVRLDLAIPPPGVDPLDWLSEGYGDLLALHEAAAPEDEGRFRISVPYRQVDLVSVVSGRRNGPESIHDLAGAEVVASEPVASLCRLLPLTPPMRASTPVAGGDALTALLQVSRGLAQVAVVDRDTARLELDARPDLQMGPVVLPDVPLVWILNVSSPRLHREVDDFLHRAVVDGLARQLAASELGSWKPYVSPDLPKVPEGALTPYDELLQWVGRQHSIDWRLLASLMYEESRFDPDAVGPGGSAGLFQFMPVTWRELGVEDPHHPREAAQAAGWYLSWLMEKFADLDLPDRVAMAIASFNVGPRHVFDARRLSAEMGFDPDVWSGNVETAMLILDDPEVARRFPSGVCRCRRAVGYTRRILGRYYAYAEQFPPT